MLLLGAEHGGPEALFSRISQPTGLKNQLKNEPVCKDSAVPEYPQGIGPRTSHGYQNLQVPKSLIRMVQCLHITREHSFSCTCSVQPHFFPDPLDPWLVESMEVKPMDTEGPLLFIEQIQMAKQHMRRCLASLVTRDMSLETTVRNYCMPTRMAEIKKIDSPSC